MPSGLTTGPAGHVERVIDGDTVEMKTGRRVRLLGIQAPEIAHGNTPAMPMAKAATRTLKSLVEDEKLQLFYDTTRRDKYDRTLAHLVRKRDGTWINRIMLTRGMARVMSFPDNRTVISSLLKAEAEARNAERGLWALPAYQVKTPESIKSAEEGFHIVAGRLVDAARVRERIYLNFEENWREDFTLRIRKKNWDIFSESGMDLLDLEGKKVRARGWVFSRNGPMMDLSHPEQIEVMTRSEVRPRVPSGFGKSADAPEPSP